MSMMSSASAFTYAISGAQTESQMQSYSSYLNIQNGAMGNLGGWFGDQMKKTMTGFTNFMNSRAWEMSKRVHSKGNGEYVSRFEIGYLGSLRGLQNAEGLMQNYIMANPLVMQGYLDGELTGYGENELNVHCTGLGKDNLFYRKAVSGILMEETVEDKPGFRVTHFRDTIGSELSFRERENIHATWRASAHHMANGMFDITSKEPGKRMTSYVPEEEETEATIEA